MNLRLCTNFTIEDCVLNATGAFQNGTISALVCNGDVVIRGNQMAVATAAGTGVFWSQFNQPFVGRMLIENNFFGPTTGFTADNGGIRFDEFGGGPFCNITIRGNTFSGASATSGAVTSVIDIDGNTVNSSNNPRVLNFGQDEPRFITCRNNVNIGTGGGPLQSFLIEGTTGCVTMENNTASPGVPHAADILIAGGASTSVYPALASIPTNNGGMSITATGVLDSPTPCPLPELP